MRKFYFFCALSFLSFNSFAFKVSPIELDFAPTGANSVKTINVENTTKSNIPVEVTAYERLHENGKEKRVLTNDFSYFPKQFILKPGEKRNIRVSWMGERPKGPNKKSIMKKGHTKISKEKAYRLKVQQVPVDLKSNKASSTGIKFLYNYIASLYVTPEKAKPSLKVLSVKSLASDTMKVEVLNVGGKHTILAYQDLFIYKANKKLKPTVLKMKNQKDEVKGINLLSGEKRSIIIKASAGAFKVGGSSFVFKKSL